MAGRRIPAGRPGRMKAKIAFAAASAAFLLVVLPAGRLPGDARSRRHGGDRRHCKRHHHFYCDRFVHETMPRFVDIAHAALADAFEQIILFEKNRIEDQLLYGGVKLGDAELSV